MLDWEELNNGNIIELNEEFLLAYVTDGYRVYRGKSCNWIPIDYNVYDLHNAISKAESYWKRVQQKAV